MATKRALTARTAAYLGSAFAILLLLIVGDELVDIPHAVFGAAATPVNWTEALLEGAYVVALGALSTALVVRLIRRVKLLEGYLPICAHCKKIRAGEEWVPLERYLSGNSEARLSHGVCPECAERHYGEYLRRAPGGPGPAAGGR